MGEGDAVKIADFGMSRVDEGGIYVIQSGTRNIPIKWTAPEVCNDKGHDKTTQVNPV